MIKKCYFMIALYTDFTQFCSRATVHEKQKAELPDETKWLLGLDGWTRVLGFAAVYSILEIVTFMFV